MHRYDRDGRSWRTLCSIFLPICSVAVKRSAIFVSALIYTINKELQKNAKERAERNEFFERVRGGAPLSYSVEKEQFTILHA